ncbi:MAG: hypothetical protein FGM39_06925, partial [Phycisphaerales bacterium]|nr:hypothetical protein [Phycisphaerales bacterium]
MIIATTVLTLWIAADVGGTAAPAVPAPAADSAPAPTPFGPASPPTGDEVDAMVREGLAFLVSAQEGEPRSQWPYEGVYRVRGEIPFGYRIGGTSIVGECLVRMPGYGSDAARREAVARACRFVCAGTSEPLMDPVYDAGYDVRGWGYCYGARFLLALRAAKAVPAGQEAEVDRALGWYLDAMQR